MLITVPFLFHIHGDPHDFGRYTDHYWSVMLEQTGFEISSIQRQGLFYAVLVDFIKQYLNQTTRGPFRRVIQWPASWLQRWALTHEQKLKVRQSRFLQSYTTGFGIVARKGRRAGAAHRG